MANFFSDVLIERDSKDISDSGTYAGSVLSTRGLLSLLTNTSSNDVLMMLDLPSNAKVLSLQLYNDPLGTAQTEAIGIYAGEDFKLLDGTKVLRNDPINSGAFSSSGEDLNGTNLDAPVENRFNSAGSDNDILRADEAIWQTANLAEDPFVNMRIGILVDDPWSGFTPGGITMICYYTAK